MPLLDLKYPLSELTRDVIAGFYRSFDSFGFGFVEPVYRRVLAVELRHAGLNIQTEVRSLSDECGPERPSAFRQWSQGVSVVSAASPA